MHPIAKPPPKTALRSNASAVSACTTDNRTWILPDYQGTSASDPLSTDSKGRCLPGDRSVCGSDTEQSGKPSRGQCKLSVYFIFKRNGNVPDRLCQSLSNLACTDAACQYRCTDQRHCSSLRNRRHSLLYTPV